MIDLIILACLAVAPDQCTERGLWTGKSLVECIAMSAPVAQLWSAQHPSRRVVMVKCRVAPFSV